METLRGDVCIEVDKYIARPEHIELKNDDIQALKENVLKQYEKTQKKSWRRKKNNNKGNQTTKHFVHRENKKQAVESEAEASTIIINLPKKSTRINKKNLKDHANYQQTERLSQEEIAKYKCVFCKEMKEEDKFSEYMIKKLRKNPAKVIQCLECSSFGIQAQNHIVCALCLRKLELNNFSKVC